MPAMRGRTRSSFRMGRTSTQYRQCAGTFQDQAQECDNLYFRTICQCKEEVAGVLNAQHMWDFDDLWLDLDEDDEDEAVE